MPDNDENQLSKGNSFLTPEEGSPVIEKNSSFPSDSKELALNVTGINVAWSKAEEAALVRKLGMFDLHFL
jgi:hypothetical protein